MTKPSAAFVNWLDRVETLLMVVLSGFMFWPLNVSSLCLILLVLVTILRKWKQALPPLKQWWVVLPAVVGTLSWLLHGLPPDGLRELQLWPIIIAAFIVFYRNPFSALFLVSFQWLSVFQAILTIAFLAFHPPFASGVFSYELREAVSAFFGIHPTYLSAAWFLAALLLAHSSKKVNPLRGAAMLLLVLCGGLVGGKMPMLAFVVVFGLWLWNRFESQRARVVALSGLLVFTCVTITFNPGLQQRFAELTALKTEFQEGDLLSSSDLRIGIWKCSFQLIEQHPLAGVGTGNTRNALEECFANFHQVEFFDGEYNTHNQFLHFGLLAGVPGSLFFFGYLLAFLVFAVKRKNPLLLVTTVYFSVLFLTENYLGRQLGMMLFSFFVILSYVHSGKQPMSARLSDSK